MNFQEIIDKYYNPKMKVVDKRQDPGYGYGHMYLLQLHEEGSDYRMALLVDTSKVSDQEPWNILQDEMELEEGQTIWDIKSRG
jgi:hypothetical protein